MRAGAQGDELRLHARLGGAPRRRSQRVLRAGGTRRPARVRAPLHQYVRLPGGGGVPLPGWHLCVELPLAPRTRRRAGGLRRGRRDRRTHLLAIGAPSADTRISLKACCADDSTSTFAQSPALPRRAGIHLRAARDGSRPPRVRRGPRGGRRARSSPGQRDDGGFTIAEAPRLRRFTTSWSGSEVEDLRRWGPRRGARCSRRGPRGRGGRSARSSETRRGRATPSPPPAGSPA